MVLSEVPQLTTERQGLGGGGGLRRGGDTMISDGEALCGLDCDDNLTNTILRTSFA